MKAKYLIGALAFSLMSTPVSAIDAGDKYVGGQLSRTDLDRDISGASDINPSAFIGRLGFFGFDNFAIEGRLGTGISDDTVQGVDFEIDSIVGVYGVGHLPLGNIASAYAVVGYSRAELTASTSGLSVDDNDSDFSYGAGFQVKITPTLSGHVEYMSYLDKSNYDFTAVGLGLNYHF
ncbi:porin family protein [Halomonas sp. BLK-85]